jgi:hypothetical protein
MQLERSEEGIFLHSEDNVSGASFSDDDDISEASDDHMSTISIEDSVLYKKDGHNDKANETHPAGIEAGAEINLGFEAPGEGYFEGSQDTDGL